MAAAGVRTLRTPTCAQPSIPRLDLSEFGTALGDLGIEIEPSEVMRCGVRHGCFDALPRRTGRETIRCHGCQPRRRRLCYRVQQGVRLLPCSCARMVCLYGGWCGSCAILRPPAMPRLWQVLHTVISQQQAALQILKVTPAVLLPRLVSTAAHAGLRWPSFHQCHSHPCMSTT